MNFYTKLQNAKNSLRLKENDFVRLYINKINKYKINSIIEYDLLTEELIEYDNYLTRTNLNNDNIDKNPMIFFFGQSKVSNNYIKRFELQENEYYIFKVASEKSEDVMQGDVYFTSSPLKKHGYSLRYVSTSNPPPTNFVFPTGNVTYRMPNLSPQIIKAYNVGQGNFTEIIMNNSESVLFDIGFTKLSHLEDILIDVSQMIYNLNPELVIISHFDIDHIMGSIYLNGNVFSKEWVIPKERNYSTSAKRLISCVLALNGSINVITNHTIINNTSQFKLHKGRGSDSNNGGLILSIHKNDKRILLPGDVDYFYLPVVLQDSHVDFIIVPHHGARIKKDIPFMAKTNGRALISYGKNTYGHPNANHIDELEKSNFIVELIRGRRNYEYKI